MTNYHLHPLTSNEFASLNGYNPKINIKNHDSSLKIKWDPDLPFLPLDITPLNINPNWDKMLQEAKNLERCFIPHRTFEPHVGWSSICLHGISSVHNDEHEMYNLKIADAPFKWTDVSHFCPEIVNFFKSLNYKTFYRLRILKLSAGGYIVPHSDTLDPVHKRISSINVALNNPEGCNFYMENVGIVPFQKHKIIALNLFNFHSVINQSNEDRYHLIIHGIQNSIWDAIYLQSYKQLT